MLRLILMQLKYSVLINPAVLVLHCSKNLNRLALACKNKVALLSDFWVKIPSKLLLSLHNLAVKQMLLGLVAPRKSLSVQFP
ncbi:hypothetical protein D3C72_1611840 [compost metagenome]